MREISQHDSVTISNRRTVNNVGLNLDAARRQVDFLVSKFSHGPTYQLVRVFNLIVLVRFLIDHAVLVNQWTVNRHLDDGRFLGFLFLLFLTFLVFFLLLLGFKFLFLSLAFLRFTIDSLLILVQTLIISLLTIMFFFLEPGLFFGILFFFLLFCFLFLFRIMVVKLTSCMNTCDKRLVRGLVLEATDILMLV